MIGFLRRRKRRTLVLMALGALAIPATAWALWSWSQSTTNLQSQTGGPPTMTFSNPTTAELAAITPCTPGGSCDLIGQVSNPTNSPVKIVSWQVSAAGDYNASNCPATNFSGPAETTASNTLTTPITVPASAVNFEIDIPNALTMAATAPTACENEPVSVANGATVSLSFTVGS